MSVALAFLAPSWSNAQHVACLGAVGRPRVLPEVQGGDPAAAEKVLRARLADVSAAAQEQFWALQDWRAQANGAQASACGIAVTNALESAPGHPQPLIH